ncbi:MAG: hypothetical protein ACYDD6_00730, partial [Acidimicrobiales bacterium]
PVVSGRAPAAPRVASVRPVPEPAVLAAIVAAVGEAWPRPVEGVERGPDSPVWRFSGRWWAKPAMARRDRPFRHL